MNGCADAQNKITTHCKYLVPNYTALQISTDDLYEPCTVGGFKNPVSCQTGKLMSGTKLSDYLGRLKQYKKAKK